MELKVGIALVSAVDDVSVIVTKVPPAGAKITCGGAPMVVKGETVTPVEADADHLGGALLGKRYVNQDGTVELLCTKGGSGALALDGTLLVTAEAKALPSSD